MLPTQLTQRVLKVLVALRLDLTMGAHGQDASTTQVAGEKLAQGVVGPAQGGSSREVLLGEEAEAEEAPS